MSSGRYLLPLKITESISILHWRLSFPTFLLLFLFRGMMTFFPHSEANYSLSLIILYYRQCQKTYTGGEIFSTCFWNSEKGTQCICTTQLCNSQRNLRKDTLLAVWMIAIFVIWIARFLWNFACNMDYCYFLDKIFQDVVWLMWLFSSPLN